MIQQGVGYTVTNSSDGQSLQIDYPPTKKTHAFLVYEDTNAAGLTVFRVKAGSINNQIPTINGISIALDTPELPAPSASSLVILTIPNSPSNYPSAQSTISFSNSLIVPDHTDQEAKLVLASVIVETQQASTKNYTVNQFVSLSLSGTRFPYGPESKLEYFFTGF
jgi:hypothetical protein